MVDIPSELAGWWRIVETSGWDSKSLDVCGPALLSLTGKGDRLRMFALLAYVNVRPAKTSASFTWQGAWEYDQLSGSGTARLRRDGRLSGRIQIKDGDGSTFIAVRAEEPDEPIPHPPCYRDKWRR